MRNSAILNNRPVIRDHFVQWSLSLNWQSPFAVTLTFKQAILTNNTYVSLDNISASKNIQYFLAFLTRSALGNSAARYGRQLTCVGALESSESIRLHAHFCIDKPPRLSDEKFYSIIVTSWNRTLFGHVQLVVEPCSDLQGWISYIAKYKSKADYLDAIDWMNVHAGC